MPKSIPLAVAALTLAALTAAPALAAPDDTVLLSRVGLNGAAGSKASNLPSLNDDGRYAAFVSSAPNLNPLGLPNPQQGILERDQSTGAFILASRQTFGMSGSQEANGVSVNPAVSGDGHQIAFASIAGNLVTLSQTNTTNAYVWDATHNVVRLASQSNVPASADCSVAMLGPLCIVALTISRDGNSVAFASAATNLVPTNPGVAEVYVHTVSDNNTQLASAVGGSPATKAANSPQLSRDGTWLVFVSDAPNLTARFDDDNRTEVYERNMVTGAVALVSQSSGFPGVAAQTASAPAISDDGRYVAFFAQSANLVPGAPNTQQAYLRDTVNNTTVAVSLADGTTDVFGAATGSSTPYAVSSDGRLVAFSSTANNLIAGLPSGEHVYVRDLHDNTTRLLDRASGPNGAIANASLDDQPGTGRPLSMSGDGRFVAYASSATNLDPAATNGLVQVYRRELEPPAAAPTPTTPTTPTTPATATTPTTTTTTVTATTAAPPPTTTTTTPPPPPSPPRPTLTKLSVSPARLHRGHRAKVGLTLNTAATVTLAFARRHCTTRRHKRHCASIAEGTLSHAEPAGRLTITITDMLGRHRLALGAHTITATARSTEGASKAAHATLTVLTR